jgi:hypothetical protein
MASLAHTLADDAVMGRQHAAHVTVPTLVLTGGNSDARADAAAQALTSVVPHSRHRVLPGRDHAVSWDVLAPELRHALSRER